MRRTLLLAGLALLAVAAPAAAGHWTNDSNGSVVGDSACTFVDPACIAAYACTGGAPPQAVDLGMYCAFRAANEAPDIVNWVALFLWDWAVDFPLVVVESTPALVAQATANEVAQVNTVLCTTVWSHFCANPAVLPEHIPLADPAGAYPPGYPYL